MDERALEVKADSPESGGEPPSDARPVSGGEARNAWESTAPAEVGPEVATDGQPTNAEVAGNAEQEAKIVTVVSGQPVDLGKADAAPAPDQPKDAPSDRAPERDPVR
jgi:hypothetical protein